MSEPSPDRHPAGLWERFRKLPKGKKVILVVFLIVLHYHGYGPKRITFDPYKAASRGVELPLDFAVRRLVDIQYERNEVNLVRGKFRLKGDTLEVFPAYEETIYRVEYFGDYEAAFDRLTKAGRFDEALDMGWPLGHVWLFSGKLDQGISRLERLIDTSGGIETRSRADTLTAASFLLMYANRYDRAILWTDEAAAIYARLSNPIEAPIARMAAAHAAIKEQKGLTQVARAL